MGGRRRHTVRADCPVVSRQATNTAAHLVEIGPNDHKAENAPAHAAAMTRIRPGSSRRPKERPPLTQPPMILLRVFVDSDARTGPMASAELILPEATSVAAAAAGECVSTRPAAAALTTGPISPNASYKLAESTRTPERGIAYKPPIVAALMGRASDRDAPVPIRSAS